MSKEFLYKEITEKLTIPTIGIGAGRYCDGQVLVINDVLGIDETFQPKFVKKYVNLHDLVKTALEGYDSEVKSGTFPAQNNIYE